MSWEQEVTRLKGTSGRIECICCYTERDEKGVEFNISVRIIDADGSLLNTNVWSEYVLFGHSPANVAGGLLFQNAAREQDRIATAIWRDRENRGVT